MSSVAQLHNHDHGCVDFRKDSPVVACPVSSKLLRSREERAGQNKRTSCIVVSFEQTSVGGTLVESSVGVVEFAVLNLTALRIKVHIGFRHRVDVIEDSRFVHVVPEGVQVVAAFESAIVEETAPVVLGEGVQKVEPGGVAGPAIAKEGVVVLIAHKHVLRENTGRVETCCLLFHAFRVDKVIFGGLDVRVNNHGDSSTCRFNLFVHLGDLRGGEVLGVENEVLISCGVTILLGPLNVAPQDVNGEAKLGKVTVAFHHHIRRDGGPFAKLVTEVVKEGHGRETSHCCQLIVHFRNSVCVLLFGSTAENEEFHGAGF